MSAYSAKALQELRASRAKLREALRTIDQAIERFETIELAIELTAPNQENR